MRLTSFYKLTLKILGLIVAMIVACRLTKDVALGLIAMAGMLHALTNQRGKALVVYLIFPFLGIFNPIILPHAGLYSVMARLGTMGMTLALLMAAVRSPGKERVPLGGLFVFLAVAALSSAQGWFPLISYLKILNFSVFVSGIYIGTRNLHHRPSDIVLLRATFIALSCIMVFGSLATLPFPAMAYITSLSYYIREGGIAYAETIFANEDSVRIALFAGITCHAQFLAPLLVCVNAWVICDMMLVEKGFHKLHVALLFLCPLLIYMTRSRVGFFGYVASIIFIYLFIIPRISTTSHVRKRLAGGVWFMLIAVIMVMVFSEVRFQTLSRWLRKTDAVEVDGRSLTEAITSSRQGGIELCMNEFRRSPLLGSGFQVMGQHRELYAQGAISLFSAPIEKGLLPLMVLGETGIVGFLVFFSFLVSFVFGCLNKKYYATLTMFGCLLATNMGEATFFSPSGGGGILWMVTVVGGFVIDMTGVIERKRGVSMLSATICR